MKYEINNKLGNPNKYQPLNWYKVLLLHKLEPFVGAIIFGISTGVTLYFISLFVRMIWG